MRYVVHGVEVVLRPGVDSPAVDGPLDRRRVRRVQVQVHEGEVQRAFELCQQILNKITFDGKIGMHHTYT